MTTVVVFAAGQTPAPAPTPRPPVRSTLQTIAIGDPNPTPKAVYSAPVYFEAPNWTRDGATLLFDSEGKIMKIALSGGTPETLDTGGATRCNGSHGLSPDGKQLAITCMMPDKPGARVYLIPMGGGTPQIVTPDANSYWHSWSPDGKTIIFTRPDHGSINLHSIGVDGQGEKELTTGTGVSDDPDFAPDGKFLYFNSNRSGVSQIWCMRPDGSNPEQITSDEFPNWTPHISPDGKWMVFLTYEKGVTGHPANKNVQLRLMSLSDRKIKVLAQFLGGSGSMNVPSWSPDSKRLAFVSYELLASPVTSN